MCPYLEMIVFDVVTPMQMNINYTAWACYHYEFVISLKTDVHQSTTVTLDESPEIAIDAGPPKAAE